MWLRLKDAHPKLNPNVFTQFHLGQKHKRFPLQQTTIKPFFSPQRTFYAFKTLDPSLHSSSSYQLNNGEIWCFQETIQTFWISELNSFRLSHYCLEQFQSSVRWSTHIQCSNKTDDQVLEESSPVWTFWCIHRHSSSFHSLQVCLFCISPSR